MKTGTAAPSITSAISKLETNDYTDLLETKNGYVILKLLERFSPGIPAFEEVESHVDETLYSQRMEPRLRQYLTGLRKDSYIFLSSRLC